MVAARIGSPRRSRVVVFVGGFDIKKGSKGKRYRSEEKWWLIVVVVHDRWRQCVAMEMKQTVTA